VIPEGFYEGNLRSLHPYTRHYLAIDLGFPNDSDRYHKRKGGMVYLGGACRGDGALSLDNPSIEEVYTLIRESLLGGNKVYHLHVFPFRMSDQRMNELLDSEEEVAWLDFWGNLKEGYDYFQILQRPPKPLVSEGQYVFR
ncbi:MAG: transcriptional regulator, partial [Verrucomicrobiota bacterium]